MYEASHYEYARQYYFNDFLSASQKEASSFFENIINVILQKEHADKGISAFIEEYPHSAYVSQASLPIADYYLSIKNFEKVVETHQSIWFIKRGKPSICFEIGVCKIYAWRYTRSYRGIGGGLSKH